MSEYSHLTPDTAKYVRVDWQDIKLVDNWGADEEIVQPVESVTAGWLLEDSETMVVIASSYDYRDERWGTVHAIPKCPPEVKVMVDQDQGGLSL